MSNVDTKQQIAQALRAFTQGSLKECALALLETLGYSSDKQFDLEPNSAAGFMAAFNLHGTLNADRAMLNQWQTVEFLFQLTKDEINQSAQLGFDFSTGQVDNSIIESYLFLAIELQPDHYTRTDLARITREVNKQFPMPVLILFKHGPNLTFSIINRRLHKRDSGKDVLEKVTLIKDIHTAQPHRAHLEILFDLSLAELHRVHAFDSFVALHRAWQTTLDSSELNKRFFKEVANWYFWAVERVTFPAGAGDDEAVRNATSVIRLITRLIFVWFLKEKGLVPDDLFNRRKLADLLTFDDPNRSTYYKAILQNLFFATLNQEMNDKRDFRKTRRNGRDQHYMIHNLYRYKRYFTNPQAALDLFSTIPFLNGGLFECLDKKDPDNPTQVQRIDGFSDRADNPLAVPDDLFFGEEREVDLNDIYGTRGKRYKVRGLIDILSSYKFTITENTPIEEEIALDPELLGKVFENLLAAYNPETETTARKQTGSFYTPREIVNYMVDESLIAYLNTNLTGFENLSGLDTEQRLRHLLAYNEEPHQFNGAETARLIEAIDRLKILDPACGSGAFPMGILHKLVFILAKLDPDNERWRATQRQKAIRETERAFQLGDKAEREKRLLEINEVFERNASDYGRKLYLIENCIYGVDIQPIAVQIAKLRFFISLVVDQIIDDRQPNRGVLPLPNLETKFVAANTLLGIERPPQLAFKDPAIDEKEKELEEVRRRHFSARTPATKEKYRLRDAEIRAELGHLLRQSGFRPATTEKLAAWNPYDQNASADFFDPEWMFEVTDGFDIVIGNPPYVRADSGDQHLELRKAIEASNQYQTLWEKWDLYIPFIEFGYHVLKPNGITTMIVSDAYCHSKYAQKSQTWFLENSRIIRLDFFSKIQIFEAAVRNITYLFQKANGSTNIPERRVHDPEFGNIKLLPSNEQQKLTYRVFFPESSPIDLSSASTVNLDQICYISVGMVVNAHEKLAPGAFQMEDLVSEIKDELHPKPFVEGKHLDRWLPATHKWLEWGTKRAPKLFRRPTFPELYEVDEKILVQRSPGPDPKSCYDNMQLYYTESTVSFIPWHSLRGVRNRSLKKVARYRNETPHRPDLPKREYLERISQLFDVKYLLGIVNSSVARIFLRANRRSNIHLYPNDWKQLPIPDVSSEQQASIVKLVNQILAAKRVNPKSDTSALEAEIDRLVYQLYGLTAEEIAIVEESVGK